MYFRNCDGEMPIDDFKNIFSTELYILWYLGTNLKESLDISS